MLSYVSMLKAHKLTRYAIKGKRFTKYEKQENWEEVGYTTHKKVLFWPYHSFDT